MKKIKKLLGLYIAMGLFGAVALMAFSFSKIEGRYLDRSYRICRNHHGIAAVNVGYQTVTCKDGFKKNFRTRTRG